MKTTFPVSPITLFLAAITVALFYIFPGTFVPWLTAVIFALIIFVAMALRMPQKIKGEPDNPHLENAVATAHIAIVMVIATALIASQFPQGAAAQAMGMPLTLAILFGIMAAYSTIRSRQWRPRYI